MKEPILKLEDVSKVYSGGICALKSTDLTLEHGVLGLLGPNGAGKTTLLRLIATLLRPTSGKIFLDEYESAKDRFRYRSLFGYLPQSFGLYSNLTAYEQLLYFASLKGIKGLAAKKEAKKLLFDVGLMEEAGRRVGEFSGGMRQRVGIAAAMIGSPRLLLVDEPTAGLDPEERIRFRALIEMASRTSIVILSTHIVQDVELGCSRVIVVDGGRILSDSSPHDFIESARGRTWVVKTDLRCCDKLKNFRSVTSVRDLQNGVVEVRFVGDQIGAGETQAEPQPEDAYINLLNSNTWSNW